MSLLWNYLRINQANTNKNNDNDTEVEETGHDSLGKLFATAKFKLDDALQLLSL